MTSGSSSTPHFERNLNHNLGLTPALKFNLTLILTLTLALNLTFTLTLTLTLTLVDKSWDNLGTMSLLRYLSFPCRFFFSPLLWNHDQLKFGYLT